MTSATKPKKTATLEPVVLKTKTQRRSLPIPKESKRLAFTKMSGAGNDFVVIDNRQGKLKLSPQQIARICHRQNGVGADGLLLAGPGPAGVDYTMEYYNADGSLADMCGNGARCFARFVRGFSKKKRERVTFQTGAGLIEAHFHGEEISITLTPPHSLQKNLIVPTRSGDWNVHFIDTGVPHVVCFVNDVESIPVQELGKEIRFHSLFAPKGANVNFVQTSGPDSIIVRTYERGVEAETLACGTGVVASSILAHVVENVGKPLKVAVRSGDELTVDFEPDPAGFRKTVLQGPATITFTGEILLS